MATLHFTTNADSGTGSLRATIAGASDGDVIQPDATVFDRATTVVVALASTLTVSKAVTIDGGANRIRLSGYNIARCCTASAVATFRNIDFVGGGVNPETGAQVGTPSGAGLQATASVTCERCGFYGCSGSYGGGIIGGSSATVSLDSCVVAGCRATNGGGVRIAGSAIIKNTTFAGNVATNASGIDDVLADAAATSVVVENTILHEKSASVALSAGCVAVDASTVGFVAPPPAGYDSNSWVYNAWENWNLRLNDDASSFPSPYRDAGDVGAMSPFDADGNFRGRVSDGVATCSPGAYETIQADLFLVSGAAASFANAGSWAVSRFATTGGATAPQSDQTLFVGQSGAFVDAAPSGANIVVSGGVVATFPTIDGGLTAGVGAGVSLAGTLATARLADFSALTTTGNTALGPVGFVGASATIDAASVSAIDGVVFAEVDQPATITPFGSGGWANVAAEATAVDLAPSDSTVSVTIAKNNASVAAFAQISVDDGATWSQIATTASGAVFDVPVPRGASVAVRVAVTGGWLTAYTSTAPFAPVWQVTNSTESYSVVSNCFEVGAEGSNSGFISSGSF